MGADPLTGGQVAILQAEMTLGEGRQEEMWHWPISLILLWTLAAFALAGAPALVSPDLMMTVSDLTGQMLFGLVGVHR